MVGQREAGARLGGMAPQVRERTAFLAAAGKTRRRPASQPVPRRDLQRRRKRRASRPAASTSTPASGAVTFYLAGTLRALHTVATRRGNRDGAYLIPVAHDTRRRGANGPIFSNHLSILFYRIEPRQAAAWQHHQRTDPPDDGPDPHPLSGVVHGGAGNVQAAAAELLHSPPGTAHPRQVRHLLLFGFGRDLRRNDRDAGRTDPVG
jgi:hypothetical protein